MNNFETRIQELKEAMNINQARGMGAGFAMGMQAKSKKAKASRDKTASRTLDDKQRKAMQVIQNKLNAAEKKRQQGLKMQAKGQALERQSAKKVQNFQAQLDGFDPI